MNITPRNNKIYCKDISVEKTKGGIVLSDAGTRLDKYLLAEVVISEVKEYPKGTKVIIPSYADKFEFEGEKYLLVHSSDIQGVCE
jgi:co-chaperonin GroES (HSP10)